MAAVSVSGPSGRITASRVTEIAPVMQRVALGLSRDLVGISS
jgi:DNA-binding IclR family transcriptional regulator